MSKKKRTNKVIQDLRNIENFSGCFEKLGEPNQVAILEDFLNKDYDNEVINEEPKMKFKCVSPNNSLIDEIIFNKNKENMNNSVRMYEYTFDEKEYSNMIETVIDGTIKINENEGNAILDYQNKKITILKDLPKETLDSEYGGSFPTTYSEVSNYYRNSLKYTCSFN